MHPAPASRLAGVQGVRAFEGDMDARAILEGLSVRTAQEL
jgi:hypothetical protein